MTDKNGKKLSVGDWVLYPWFNSDRDYYDFLVGKITRLYGRSCIVHPSGSKSTCSLVEKLPEYKKSRDNLVFLKYLEGFPKCKEREDLFNKLE